MIHNRKICKQIDMTDDDLLILLHLGLPVEPRKTDRADAAIMLQREEAKKALGINLHLVDKIVIDCNEKINR